jgi:hypothetical protein
LEAIVAQLGGACHPESRAATRALERAILPDSYAASLSGGV